MKLMRAALAWLALCCCSWASSAQEKGHGGDTLSTFDRFNKRAEHFFRIFPVPVVSYSTDAGHVFGLAKFNVFRPDRRDMRSRPSRISGVVSVSTKGRANVFIANDLILKENRYMILNSFNYKRQPELLFGIGNDAGTEAIERVTINRLKFASTTLMRVHRYLYAGASVDLSDYYAIDLDSNSFLLERSIHGREGGRDVGVGLSAAFDSRDNRYNASQGAYVLATIMAYPDFLGSTFAFRRFDFDARRYFRVWHRHVVAIQATTSYTGGDVPFYDLPMLGGEERMRGYYKGAYRDNVLVDSQAEYRMPAWNIFGVVAWVGAGRVVGRYGELSLNGFKLSYGGGIRVRVDSRNNTNLRFDIGFGQGGMQGIYFNFAEAF